MILASHARNVNRVERCRGQLETARVQLGLSNHGRIKSMLSRLKQFGVNKFHDYEEFFFVGCAFGLGVGLAVVVICVINSIL